MRRAVLLLTTTVLALIATVTVLLAGGVGPRTVGGEGPDAWLIDTHGSDDITGSADPAASRRHSGRSHEQGRCRGNLRGVCH